MKPEYPFLPWAAFSVDFMKPVPEWYPKYILFNVRLSIADFLRHLFQFNLSSWAAKITHELCFHSLLISN